MDGNIHIGGMIAMLLDEQNRTKRDLALDLGLSQSNVVYLTKRESIDVKMLHRIGNNLRYNFWKHFPINVTGTGLVEVALAMKAEKVAEDKDKLIAELQAKVAEVEAKVAEKNKEIEALKQELVKQENNFLKEINGLLKRKG